MLCRWLPDESRAQVRSIIVEVTAKQGRHEERDDRDWLMKMRQFPLEAQVRLVTAEAVNGKVGALNVQDGADLRRYTLVPRQSLAKHHRFADEHDRWSRGIDWFIDSANR